MYRVIAAVMAVASCAMIAQAQTAGTGAAAARFPGSAGPFLPIATASAQ